jgi:hypothetical protein
MNSVFTFLTTIQISSVTIFVVSFHVMRQGSGANASPDLQEAIIQEATSLLHGG